MAIAEPVTARRPAPPELPRRRVDFAFDTADVPVTWYGDDLFLSLFGDALSLLFPEGECFFVDSVRHFKDSVDDPALRAAMLGFAGQEAMHGKEHQAFTDMLVTQGLDNAPDLERELRKLLGVARKVLSPKAQLAVTCALEHFTATLAEQLLTEDEEIASMHPSVRPLWLWHAYEESEHKSVAFDVYEHVGGTYGLRVAIMLLTTAIFIAELTHFHGRFLAKKGLLHRPDRWGKGIAHLWGSPGIFRKLVPPWLDYFRPGFHPTDRDTTELLDGWRPHLFGETGMLGARLRSSR